MLISILHLLWIVPASVMVGFLILALLTAAKDDEADQVIAYICDEKSCEYCQADKDNRQCYHTLDIRHAANFEEVGPGMFIEKE